VAQVYGEPDRGAPGDPMIQEYLRQATGEIERDFLANCRTAEEWNQARERHRREYFHMLGLWPMPERTPLNATITRTLDRGDYSVDLLHYQSRPGLYVTGNLYRPARVPAGERLPAILYVCGHSPHGQDGNKTQFQSHGIWFARHGYVCLIVDTLEMGEITCTHHGTYREGRWWWLSRGYTPAGVECWNGVRGLDYLAARADVDPERLGVTGISGGGAATTWIAAGDERVKAAAPVSGWSDLTAHVPNRVVNGHCDCMFHYNTYQWSFARVLGMIAPRPLFFVNSDADPIFPMDGNERMINRLERLYSLFGAGDRVDSLVSVGGHDYRRDIREGVFRFMNIHLKNDPRPIQDSEVDLVTHSPKEFHPIPPEQLRVFPTGGDFPKDAINGRIDYEFVPMAKAGMPADSSFQAWKEERIARLKEFTFHHFPDPIPAGEVKAEEKGVDGIIGLRTEPGITVRLQAVVRPEASPRRVFLLVAEAGLGRTPPSWLSGRFERTDAVYFLEPRGVGETRWTTKNPPNYVERSHYLLGRTVDGGRVWDIAAAAGYLRGAHPGAQQLVVAGEGGAAALAVYGALLSSRIDALILKQPPASHMENAAPALLNVLRVCDLPEAIGMLAPRPVELLGAPTELAKRAGDCYRAAGAEGRCVSND
jgi:dienelactone hydrolase